MTWLSCSRKSCCRWELHAPSSGTAGNSVPVSKGSELCGEVQGRFLSLLSPQTQCGALAQAAGAMAGAALLQGRGPGRAPLTADCHGHGTQGTASTAPQCPRQSSLGRALRAAAGTAAQPQRLAQPSGPSAHLTLSPGQQREAEA